LTAFWGRRHLLLQTQRIQQRYYKLLGTRQLNITTPSLENVKSRGSFCLVGLTGLTI